MPARRSTSQSYLMLCAALGTRASDSSSRSGAMASLAGGGRLRGGVPPASAPSGATCANGRYHERPGATASDMPTISARIGSSADVSVSSATSRARRHSATTAASAAGSSTIVGSTARAVSAGAPATAGACRSAGAGLLVPTASSDPSFGMSERNSSSVKSSLKRATSGGRTRSPSRSSVIGTSRRIVTRSRDSRATPAGVQERDAGPDQLVEILVPRHDDDLDAAGCRLDRERPDDVVRLVPLDPDDRHAEGGEDLLDPFDGAVELLLQLGGELLARRLVRGVGLLPKRLAHVVHPREVVGPPPVQQADQEVGDSPGGGRVLAAPRRERTGDHREEGPVDQGVAVDEIEGRLRLGHGGTNIQKPRPAVLAGGATRMAWGRYTRTTFMACSPLSPVFTSNSTACPSASVLKPSIWIAEKCTNTSSPASCSMKPYPLASLNHFTFPLDIRSASCKVTRWGMAPARPPVERDRNDAGRRACQAVAQLLVTPYRAR